MAEGDNIIPGQGIFHKRPLYVGQGQLDPKVAVLTYTELLDITTNAGTYFSDGTLVWVNSDRRHYMINKDVNGVINIVAHELGDGGSSSNFGLMYFGGEQNVYNWTYNNNTGNYNPSLMGYKNGDLIVSSSAITLNDFCTEFDTWLVKISVSPQEDGYVYNGTIKGDEGDEGVPGIQGDPGESFVVNCSGLFADRPLCTSTELCNGNVGPAGVFGWSYLATDQGLLYFVESDGAGGCKWSDTGVPFGKGDPGRSTYSMFRASSTVLNGTHIPPEGMTQREVLALVDTGLPYYGWSDGVPTVSAGTEKRVYMIQALYSVEYDSFGDEINTTPSDFPWSLPITLSALDGMEGKKAGFWVLWSESISKPVSPINLPEDNIDGTESWTKVGTEPWFDDVNIGDPSRDKPIWTATSLYNKNTGWGPWVIGQLAGERPPYTLNIFTRWDINNGDPLIPHTPDLLYVDINGDFSSGQDAATAANDPATNPGGAVWSDGPPAYDPLLPDERLFMSQDFLYNETSGNGTDNWSVPVELDGKEGDDSGIWTIWSNSTAVLENDILPTLNNPNIMIDNVNDTIDLPPMDPGTGWSWSDISRSDTVWMASTYFRKGVWSAWTYTHVKGEKGEDGANFTVDSQGNGAPTSTMYCDKEKGWSYLDLDNSLIYFKTTDLDLITPCTGVGWSAGSPFGKGSNGENSYNIFAMSATIPIEPIDNTKIGNISSPWNDSPPAKVVGQKLWLSTTNYAVSDSGETTPNPFSWSEAVYIDGEEGISSGTWIIWSAATAPSAPGQSITINDDGSLTFAAGSQWYDDTLSIGSLWMASTFYRPAKTDEQGDSNGWIWTEWIVAKVKGESGDDGLPGDPAFTYIPDTNFILRPLVSTDQINGKTPNGWCLTESAGVYSIDTSGNIIIGTETFGKTGFDSYHTIHDGVPITANDERVWMIQGVFNSNDNLCSGGAGNLMYWTLSILSDSSGMDYKYHRGDDALDGKAGTKPVSPDIDITGWFDDPDDVSGGAYWLAQKNWAVGPSAQWVIYQIRGENGDSSEDPTLPDEVWYTSLQPYNSTDTGSISPADVILEAGTPTTHPNNWVEERITGSTKAPSGAWDASDFASTYKITRPSGGVWNDPTIIIDRSGIEWSELGMTYDSSTDNFTSEGGGEWYANAQTTEVARLNDMTIINIVSGDGTYSRFLENDVIKFDVAWGRPVNAAAWHKIN